jgi:hypothetical protein
MNELIEHTIKAPSAIIAWWKKRKTEKGKDAILRYLENGQPVRVFDEKFDDENTPGPSIVKDVFKGKKPQNLKIMLKELEEDKDIKEVPINGLPRKNGCPRTVRRLK